MSRRTKASIEKAIRHATRMSGVRLPLGVTGAIASELISRYPQILLDEREEFGTRVDADARVVPAQSEDHADEVRRAFGFEVVARGTWSTPWAVAR